MASALFWNVRSATAVLSNPTGPCRSTKKIIAKHAGGRPATDARNQCLEERVIRSMSLRKIRGYVRRAGVIHDDSYAEL